MKGAPEVFCVHRRVMHTNGNNPISLSNMKIVPELFVQAENNEISVAQMGDFSVLMSSNGPNECGSSKKTMASTDLIKDGAYQHIAFQMRFLGWKSLYF